MAVSGKPVCNFCCLLWIARLVGRSGSLWNPSAPAWCVVSVVREVWDLRPHSSLREHAGWCGFTAFPSRKPLMVEMLGSPAAQAQERRVHLSYLLCGFMGERLSSAYNSHCISSIVSSTGRITPDVNCSDQLGNTPLHCAAYRAHKQCALKLLKVEQTLIWRTRMVSMLVIAIDGHFEVIKKGISF